MTPTLPVPVKEIEDAIALLLSGEVFGLAPAREAAATALRQLHAPAVSDALRARISELEATVDGQCATIMKSADAVHSAQKRISELEAALEPIAELWYESEASYQDELDSLDFYGYSGVMLCVGHLRNAAKAMKGE